MTHFHAVEGEVVAPSEGQTPLGERDESSPGRDFVKDVGDDAGAWAAFFLRTRLAASLVGVGDAAIPREIDDQDEMNRIAVALREAARIRHEVSIDRDRELRPGIPVGDAPPTQTRAQPPPSKP